MPIEPGSRAEKNSLAFLDHLAGMGGYQLRPVSYYTLEVIGLLQLKIGDESARDGLTPLRLQDEIHVFLFVQAAPLPIVARAVRGFRARLAEGVADAEAFEQFMIEHVEPFLTTLTPESKAELRAQLAAVDEIESAKVTAAPPRGSKQEPDDPNS